jgi:hypothetical protein
MPSRNFILWYGDKLLQVYLQVSRGLHLGTVNQLHTNLSDVTTLGTQE